MLGHAHPLRIEEVGQRLDPHGLPAVNHVQTRRFEKVGVVEEPDVALVKLRDDAYATAHPQPEDVLLVVEVSDTSLEYDLTEKLPRYAASGIPEVWLVDLVNNILEVYREPISQPNGTAAYRQRTNYYAGDTIELLMFPDIKLDVAQIL